MALKNYQKEADLFDRLMGVATYVTFGMAGLIWLILSFFLKKTPSGFLSYHIYQSIFLSLLIYILSLLFGIALGFMASIPFLSGLAKWIEFFFNTPMYFGYSLIHLTIVVFVGYLALGAFLGKYSYLPFISDIIGSNFRR